MRAHLFPSSPASKLVGRKFREAEPRRLSGTASVWCWFALQRAIRHSMACWRRVDAGPLAFSIVAVLWHAGASWHQQWSVLDCRRQVAPFLDLYRRTRHVGVWSWSSTIWVPINVVLHDHARKPVDLQPWTSYARVKHDRKSNKNSEAVTGNLWKINVSVSWLFGNFFFVSNPGQLAVHQVYKFVTSLIRSDRIVEYSFVR